MQVDHAGRGATNQPSGRLIVNGRMIGAAARPHLRFPAGPRAERLPFEPQKIEKRPMPPLAARFSGAGCNSFGTRAFWVGRWRHGTPPGK